MLRRSYAPSKDQARRSDSTVIVERYIDGPEIAVGLLDGEVLGAVEIRPATEFYDYEAKYERNDTVYTVDPDIDIEISRSIQDQAKQICESSFMSRLNEGACITSVPFYLWTKSIVGIKPSKMHCCPTLKTGRLLSSVQQPRIHILKLSKH